MKTLLTAAALLPLAAPANDTPCPEIGAAHWSNQFGQAPSLETLRGRAILIENWATW